MNKYTTNKSNTLTKKQSIFKRYKFLKEEILQTKKNIKILEKRRVNKPRYEVEIIEEQIIKHKEYLERLNKSRLKLKKRFVTVAATLGILLTVATNSYGAHIENENFDKNFNAAYHQVQQNDEQSSSKIQDGSDILYQQLKLDIETYTKLIDKEKLSREEKEQMDNAKKRINANPEGITRLSLDILKQKIANSLEIDDYSKIKIIDDSTQISAGKYHRESGSKTDIAILVDGKTIASLEKFASLPTGEVTTSSNTIPKDVLKVINKIVNAQKDSQDTKKATKALKSSLDLDEKDILFENGKAKDLNEER